MEFLKIHLAPCAWRKLCIQFQDVME
uniref:Uncharacterized protein n=1 Tax=Rhizophora mucronata TaxID=61149 RepID=A0A2P2NJP3_RHIMU